MHSYYKGIKQVIVADEVISAKLSVIEANKILDSVNVTKEELAKAKSLLGL
jgi:hypothetical protein